MLLEVEELGDRGRVEVEVRGAHTQAVGRVDGEPAQSLRDHRDRSDPAEPPERARLRSSQHGEDRVRGVVGSGEERPESQNGVRQQQRAIAHLAITGRGNRERCSCTRGHPGSGVPTARHPPLQSRRYSHDAQGSGAWAA